MSRDAERQTRWTERDNGERKTMEEGTLEEMKRIGRAEQLRVYELWMEERMQVQGI